MKISKISLGFTSFLFSLYIHVHPLVFSFKRRARGTAINNLFQPKPGGHVASCSPRRAAHIQSFWERGRFTCLRHILLHSEWCVWFLCLWNCHPAKNSSLIFWREGHLKFYGLLAQSVWLMKALPGPFQMPPPAQLLRVWHFGPLPLYLLPPD